MKHRILMVTVVFVMLTLITGTIYAAGDLIVNGNLGVGTSSPQGKADINGNMIVQGNLSTSGTTTLGGNTTVNGNFGIGAASTDSNLQVNGTVRMFGQWSAKSPDTVYQATTDGFVIVNPTENTPGSYYKVYTDANNPPTTMRVRGKSYGPSGSAAPATIPVRKGDYWKVETYYYSAPENVWWMPLGL